MNQNKHLQHLVPENKTIRRTISAATVVSHYVFLRHYTSTLTGKELSQVISQNLYPKNVCFWLDTIVMYTMAKHKNSSKQGK